MAMTVDPRSELGQHIPIHYHYQMLADAERMHSFATAIRQRVSAGMRVADLGSGTGVLAFFAAQCGAKVWAVEAIPELAQRTRRFLQANGVGDATEVINGDAQQWLPPEPVDLVTCEMLHSALLREKQVAVLQDFRNAHIQRFGVAPQFLPEATLLAIQPVTQDYFYDGYYAPLPLFQSAYSNPTDCLPRGEPVLYLTVDYNDSGVDRIQGEVPCTASQPATVNAIRFITRSVLAVDLARHTTVDWYSQHLIVPLPEPVTLEADQELVVHFDYLPGDPIAALYDSLRATLAPIGQTRSRQAQLGIDTP
jgi:predicted RNA methylase